MHFEFPAFGHSWASSTTKMPSFRRWIKQDLRQVFHQRLDKWIILLLLFCEKKQQNEWSCDVRQNLFKTESKL